MDTIDPSALTEGTPGPAAPAVTPATVTPEFAARFALEFELGRGAGGQVWRALDRKNGRRVAVKFLGGARTQGELERFMREGRLLAKLASPHLVKVYELDAMAGIPYLVTELLEGGTLRAQLTGVPLPPRRAVDLACAILEGLAVCHAAGVVHRDLKPENVLFGADGLPRVADLGVASDAEGASLTKTGALVGTPRYMAPEQARGEPVGPAADLYSVGLMLYEMLAGKHPCPARGLAETLTWHVSGNLPRLDGPLGPVIGSAMAKTPAGRPASALAFRDELRRALSKRSGRIPPRTGGGSRPSSPGISRLSRGQFVAALAAGALLAFALGWRATRVPAPVASVSAAPDPRASAGAELARAVRWGADQADRHHRSLNVVRKWVGKVEEAAATAAEPHAGPKEIGTKLDAAVNALSAEVEGSETPAEAHWLARARGVMVAAWTGEILDAYLARGTAGRSTLADLQGDETGVKSMWSAADAEYPAAGAEYLRRYLTRLAAVAERIASSSEVARADLDHLSDVLRMSRCFSRIRWVRSAAREYTGALDRFRQAMRVCASRPRGAFARALNAGLDFGLDCTTGTLVARRFDELSAACAQLAADQPALKEWLDALIARIAVDYGHAIGSARKPARK